MGIWLYLRPHQGGHVSARCDVRTVLLVYKVLLQLKPEVEIFLGHLTILKSNLQVPPASIPLVEPGKADDPHLLGLDPGLPGHSGALLQCRQSGGQEVDGDEAE